MKSKYLLYLILWVVFTTGCNEIIKTVTDATEEEKEVKGTYHLLTSCKIFLPKGFQPITIDDFGNQQRTFGLDSTFINGNQLQLERMQRWSKDFRLFFDEMTNGFICVSQVDYTPINKETALQAVALIENGISNNTKVTYQRMDAKFNSYSSFTMLKSVFKIHNIQQNADSYKCLYMVSNNSKTYMIITDTVLQPDFEKYIQQIKM